MSPLRSLLPAVAALGASAGPAAAAGDPVMPLSQVQRGMHCTGYSVIRGTDVSSFDVTVDDVVYDAVDTADILITISGPAVDGTGAGPGFSGSPIYCPSPDDGTPKVIGALSFGIGDYDNKTMLATPIEAMLGEPVVPPSSARRATSRERRARPLGLSLSVSGLSPAIARVWQQAARRGGRTLYAAPAAPRATSFAPQPLRPGSAVAVGYSSGDVALGGIGTVTYVDGPSVWAFGHPLDSVGRRSLFLEDAYVYGIINSPSIGGGQSTYKLAAPGHDIGTLTGDGAFSVSGITGPLPPRYGMAITSKDRDRGTSTSLAVQLADERAIGNPTGISPLGFAGTGAIAQAAYATLHGSPLNTSGDMCVSIKVKQHRDALGFCNRYVQAGTGLAADGASALAGAPFVADFGTAASLLDSYRLGPLDVENVNVTMELWRGLAQAFMTGLSGPSKWTRGKDYKVTLAYKRAGGKTGKVSFKVHAPLGMTTGKRDLVLTGTPSDLAGGLSSQITGLLGGGTADEAGPASVKELSKQIAGIHRYDGITASFRPRHGEDEELGSPTADSDLPGGAEGRALRERDAYRSGSVRYSGAVSIPVVVR